MDSIINRERVANPDVELAIERSAGLIRAAVLEDGRLCEIHSERDTGDALAEAIFYGRVQAVKPSLGAAFVDIGQENNAFLPLEEGETLRGGQWVIVQVLAHQTTRTKGLRVTRRVNLAGRWLVLVPGDEGVYLSKKIKDGELRAALREWGQAVCPDGCALIVRTATQDVTAQQLEAEAQALHVRWRAVQARALGMMRPGVLEAREPLDVRMARDLAGRGLARVVTNDGVCAQALMDMQREEKIPPGVTIERFEEAGVRLFDALDVEAQIDKALKSRVWLPCGGYLVIDFCEAMTVIDVNSGKMTLGRDIGELALRVNLEAVREAARQIRLRDIGGIIVIDLIDMAREEDRAAVIAALREAAARDLAQVKVEGVTRLGLLELTRRRKGEQLRRTLRTSCSFCHGAGEILSGEEVARRALRQVHRMALAGQRGPFLLRCAAPVAAALEQMTSPVQLPVYALAVGGRHPERFDIEQLGDGVQAPQGAALLRLPGEGG